MTDLRTAAVDLAMGGLPIVPLHSVRDGRCTCGDPECEHPGKHPRTQHGLNDASADPDQAWWWWERWRDANIGIRTGKPSGLVVLDEDGEEGRESLAALEARYGALVETLTARSGRVTGGKHRYFAYAGNDIKNSVGQVGAGLDVRANGGMIVAPPSVHYTGNRYEWLNDIDPAPLPGWLRLLMLPLVKASPRPASSSTCNDLARRARIYIAAAKAVGRGVRNSRLFKLAGNVASLVDEHGGRLGEAVIVDLLQDFNRRCDPPLDEKELVTVVRSALTTGTPRELKPALSNTEFRIKRGLSLRGREVCNAD